MGGEGSMRETANGNGCGDGWGGGYQCEGRAVGEIVLEGWEGGSVRCGKKVSEGLKGESVGCGRDSC